MSNSTHAPHASSQITHRSHDCQLLNKEVDPLERMRWICEKTCKEIQGCQKETQVFKIELKNIESEVDKFIQ